MGNQTQKPVSNVTNPTTSTGTGPSQIRFSAQALHEYVAGVARGDAPITTLLQQGDAESNIAVRRAKVMSEVGNAIAKYNQASNN